MKTKFSLAAMIIIVTQCSSAQVARRGAITFNSDYVQALAATMDLGNSVDVFRSVFSSLDNEIFVYPTEGYYYFSFNANGATIKGNIAFFADARDEGRINFAYYEDSRLRVGEMEAVWYNERLDTAGVELREIDGFTYLLSFEGRTVRVSLNDITRPAESRLELAPNEEYVGTTFDESGLSFYLVFNAAMRHLFWVLNEDIAVDESFTTVSQSVVIGRRTEFAFYDDTRHGRLVLFGVQRDNVERNTIFDGPFDQLPDNYVYTGQLDLASYLEAAYPHARGRINEYGIYNDEVGTRIAVSSYAVYDRRVELGRLVSHCRSNADSESEFLTALTSERESARDLSASR